jgi:release factor glutamine methyltransferase
VTRQPLRLAVLEAERILAKAGVASPRADAEMLAAHVLGTERTRLPLIPLVDPPVVEQLRRLVEQRAARVPLQHLTGWSAMGAITVSVGPGVFVPRPETELLLGWGLAFLEGTSEAPVVVDLCTGSGALALAVANARPDAVVHAVDIDPSALAWARRNANLRVGAGDTPIALHCADVTRADVTRTDVTRTDVTGGHVTYPDIFAELDGTAHLVLCNPPYVPSGAEVPPEVADHDPRDAVFAGPDGLAVIRPVVSTAARLLRPGGALAIEHDDTHGEAVPALLRARTVLTDVEDHEDLTGRPRFATARRAP